MRLIIPESIIEQIVTQARAAAPVEACGILGGVDERITTCYEMENADNSPDHFTLVPKEQFGVVKAMRTAGEAMLAVYHSHPASPARPSEEDIRMAYTPDVVYIIVSVAGDEPVVKGFDIQGSEVREVPVEIDHTGDTQ